MSPRLTQGHIIVALAGRMPARWSRPRCGIVERVSGTPLAAHIDAPPGRRHAATGAPIRRSARWARSLSAIALARWPTSDVREPVALVRWTGAQPTSTRHPVDRSLSSLRGA
jgi:hypothetical protein